MKSPIWLSQLRARSASSIPDAVIPASPGGLVFKLEDRKLLARDLSAKLATVAPAVGETDAYVLAYRYAPDHGIPFRANLGLLGESPELFEFTILGLDFDLASNATLLSAQGETPTPADGPLDEQGKPAKPTHAQTSMPPAEALRFLRKGCTVLQKAAILSPSKGGYRAFLFLDEPLTVGKWSDLLHRVFESVMSDLGAIRIGTKGYIRDADGKVFCCLDLLTDPTRLMRVPFGFRGGKPVGRELMPDAIINIDTLFPTGMFGELCEVPTFKRMPSGRRRTYAGRLPPPPENVPVLEPYLADNQYLVCSNIPDVGNRDSTLFRRVAQVIETFPVASVEQVYALLLPFAEQLSARCPDRIDWRPILWDKVCRLHTTALPQDEAAERDMAAQLANMFDGDGPGRGLYRSVDYARAIGTEDGADAIWKKLTSPTRERTVFLNLPPGYSKSEVAKRYMASRKLCIYAAPTRAERDRIWNGVSERVQAERMLSHADCLYQALQDIDPVNADAEWDLLTVAVDRHTEAYSRWRQVLENGRDLSALLAGDEIDQLAYSLSMRHPRTGAPVFKGLVEWLFAQGMLSKEQADLAEAHRRLNTREVFGAGATTRRGQIAATHVVCTHAALKLWLESWLIPVEEAGLRDYDRRTVLNRVHHTIIVDEAHGEDLACPDRLNRTRAVEVYGKPYTFPAIPDRSLPDRRKVHDFLKHHNDLVLVNASVGVDAVLAVDGYTHEVVRLDSALKDEDLAVVLVPEMTTLLRLDAATVADVEKELLLPDRQRIADLLVESGFTVITNGQRYDVDEDGITATGGAISATNNVNAIGKNHFVNSKVASLIAHPHPQRVASYMRVHAAEEVVAINALVQNDIRQLTGRNTGWRSYARCQEYWRRNGLPEQPKVNSHVCIMPFRLGMACGRGLDILTTQVFTAWSARDQVPPAVRKVLDLYTVKEAVLRSQRKYSYTDIMLNRGYFKKIVPRAADAEILKAAAEAGIVANRKQTASYHIPTLMVNALKATFPPDHPAWKQLAWSRYHALKKLSNQLNYRLAKDKVNAVVTVDMLEATFREMLEAEKEKQKGG